jgi:IS30 family transposase
MLSASDKKNIFVTVKIGILTSVIKMSRKVLTLSERVEAIKLHDDGKSSLDVAQIMGIGRTQIQQIIKRKSEVLDDYESNVSNDRKREVLTLVAKDTH